MTGRFFIDGEAHADEPFVYRISGLDEVVLLNGFERVETDYGDGIVIANMDDLHIAIALDIIANRKILGPREFRFLRREMDLTQNRLGDQLGIDGQTVARYEKGETRISGPADRLVRFLFVFKLLPQDMQKEIIDQIVDTIDRDDTTYGPTKFTNVEGHWREAC